ncbi:unnamed protein product [Mytilus coruscus]|uniref:Uncharacterized protein n=1 Tax=Mytilus coruscus TaxID=42192 RepID=A0A6J8C921_MYTCO|nr:unnamed protein product [Mytilus coruscus]
MQCSFKTVSSKPCSTIQGSSLITSLSTCKNDIANHLRNCLLQREGLIKNEDDLLRFRGGYFEESSSSLTICPTHRYEFWVTWRKSVYCVLQFACGGNKKPRKARQDCSVNSKQSLYMWKEEQRLIPVGSGRNPSLLQRVPVQMVCQAWVSWHVGVVSMKTDQNDYQNFTIVHVFDNATQDALTSTSILQDTINHINKENKKIKTLYLRSDNAGCFHSSYSLTTIPMINKKSLIKIKRVDFSDPQGGKCICDRKKGIKRYVNEGTH